MTTRKNSIEARSGNRKQGWCKTDDTQVLGCSIKVDGVGGNTGTVIEVSRSGIRLRSVGQYRVGQMIQVSMNIEWLADGFHGEVRSVEPTGDGETILGCSMNETIGDAVLHKLADQGLLTRRSDPRIQVTHRARMFWQMTPEQVTPEQLDILLRDYSNGGLMIQTDVAIPDDNRLRLLIAGEDEKELCVETRLQWKRASGNGCLAGLAFIDDDSPQRVARVLGLANQDDQASGVQKCGGRGQLVFLGLAAILILIAGAAVLQISGVDVPWGMVLAR